MSYELHEGLIVERTVDSIRIPTAVELIEDESSFLVDMPDFEISESIWLPVFTYERVKGDTCSVGYSLSVKTAREHLELEFALRTGIDYVISGNRILPVGVENIDVLKAICSVGGDFHLPLEIHQIVELDQLIALSGIEVLGGSERDVTLKSEAVTNFQSELIVDPYPYQKVGIEWLKANKRVGISGVILADVMGLGKTLQLIGLVLDEVGKGHLRNLVICPGTLVQNWKNEFSKFAPSLDVYVHQGSARTGISRHLENHEVVVSTYDVLIQDNQLFSNIHWNVLALDEAQAIKNPDAKRSKIVKSLSRRFGVAATGTPLENSLLDFWSIGDFARNTTLPPRALIESVRSMDVEDQVATAEALNEAMRPIMLRRQLDDVQLQLPEKVIVDHALEWPAELNQIYSETRQKAISEFAHAGGLVAVTRLRILTTHPALAGISFGDPRAMSPKFTRMVEILDELLIRNEKAIIFCSYSKAIDLIADWLAVHYSQFSVYTLDGRTPMGERQQVVSSFNAHQRGSILVANPTVAGAGLNVTGANHVILFNLEWNPAKEAQAIARVHRNGQLKTCFIHRFYYAKTVEEVINQRLLAKRNLAAIGVDGQLTREDILAALEVQPGA